MKLIRGQQINQWKIMASLIFSLLFLTVCKSAVADEAKAGLCNGAWGLAGGYYCDILPIGGGNVLCVFMGRDNDRNGVYRSGTSDECKVDVGGHQQGMDCNEMCRLNNNCARITCPVGKELDEINARSKTLSGAKDKDD